MVCGDLPFEVTVVKSYYFQYVCSVVIVASSETKLVGGNFATYSMVCVEVMMMCAYESTGQVMGSEPSIHNMVYDC